MQTKAKPIGHQVHSFEMYPSTPISRSVFNRSHSLSTTMNANYLVPIWYDMAYPGDTLKLGCNVFSRLATQIVPFMDNMYMDIHVWCVPIRLIWSHWKNFNGEQPQAYDPANPSAGTDYLTPQLTTTTTSQVTANSIYDYFDIPLGISGLSFNSFNFRAYNLVWNEWYRDENLQDPVVVRLGDNGVDTIADFTLLKRGKRKDYFTSCLPFPQKGPSVDLPLGGTAPVTISNKTIAVAGNGKALGLTNGTLFTGLTNSSGTLRSVEGAYGVNVGTQKGNVTNMDQQALGVTSDTTGKSGLVAYANGLTGTADMTNVTSSTINGLRQAFALQRLFEKDARGGTRYTEMILSHFGVKSPDERLQRPEFLGGGTFNLNLNVVPQTSSTATGVTPQGNLSSFGTISGRSSKIVKSFTEHCVVFAVASIRADLTYQQGLPRDYSKRARTDYYLPTLANLGEQAVLNKEIFAQGSSVKVNGEVVDEQVFGYQERWAEMRYKSNRITGQLRSTANLSLDIWHLAQDFSNLPTLNSDFIEENVPVDRVIAISGANQPQFISNFYFDEQWIRPMPVYSIPSMSSHF